MSAASEIVPIMPMPKPISSRLFPRSRSTTNPKITLTASTTYPDGSCCIPKSRKADNDTPNAGARAQENRGGASTSVLTGAVVTRPACHSNVGSDARPMLDQMRAEPPAGSGWRLSKRAAVPFAKPRAQLKQAQVNRLRAQLGCASTDLEIGVGGDVVGLDPPIGPGAMPVDTHPGAVRKPAEHAPVFERHSDEPAGTNPTGQPVRDDHDSGMIFRGLGDLGQYLEHPLGNLARALAGR